MSDNERYLIVKNEDAEKDDFHLMDFLHPIFNNRWAIVAITVAGVLAAMAFNHFALPVYKAKSTIVIRLYTSTNVISERDSEQPDIVRPSDFMTKVRMITSQPVMEKLATRLIARGYWSERLEQMGWEGLDPERKAKFIRGRASSIRGGVIINNPRDTNLVMIQYNSSDPEMAKDVVNLLAELVVEVDLNEHSIIMKRSLAYLNDQLAGARKRVGEL